MNSDESLTMSEEGLELLHAVREALAEMEITTISADGEVGQRLRRALEAWEEYEVARVQGIDHKE